MTLEETLSKRSNISFFRKDKIPEKSLIQEIIDKAHTLTPHKNNFWHYEIEVYGPEHEEEKKYATLATVCSDAKEKYTKLKPTSKDFEDLEKIYDLWLENHKNIKTEDDFLKFWETKNGKVHFNNQVRAPYLLVYTKRDELLTETQKKSNYYKKGRLDEVFDVNYQTRSDMWLIQAGMHSIITSALAVDKGLDASFCKCFFYNTNIHTNILRKAKRRPGDIAFLLGLGYKDSKKYHYKSNVPKPTLDEIVKWQ